MQRKPITLVDIDLPYCRRTFGNGLCGASLVAETTRENVALWSEDYTNARYTKTRSSITANSLTAPDGTLTADKLVEDTSTNTHYLRTTEAVTNGQAVTFSRFMRAAGRSIVQMRFSGSGNPTQTIEFDLSTGVLTPRAGTPSGRIALDLPSGFYRCEMTFTPVVTVSGFLDSFLCNAANSTSYTGDGSSGVHVWGEQRENGSGASNYKATTSATVSGLWAGDAAKCFNSRATCAYPAAFVAEAKTVTFCYNQDGIPDAPGVFPALKSVSSRPGELNLSGIDPRSTALGIRARVTVTIQDFANNDTWTDMYQAERVSGAALASGVGYQPNDRGRFLARLMARFPYYLGLPLRVKRGYVGDDPSTMPTENYVISELTGPNAAGELQITAKDVLDLADNKKAVYPAASSGKLLEALTATATSATLTPTGIGSEYPASGLARIGREIVSFTRSGDVLTLTRAQEGTTAQTHSALDLVQVCGVLDGLTFNAAIEAILKDGTTEFDAYIDTAAWQAENDTWLAGTTIGRVIITKPTGKAMLIGEICQLGVMVWWDAVAQEIRYKVNSPLFPGESYYPITDGENLIKGSPDVDRAEDQRISALWLYHGVRDWTDETLAARNFNKLSIGAVTENLYGQEAYKEIFTRWFGRLGDEGSAAIIAERLVARYRNPPKIVSGTLDVKDRASVNLGARVIVESYVLQDVDGSTLAVPMQVNYAEYTDGRVKFRAEEYRIDGQFGFWMDDGTAPTDYASATADQRATGAFWADEAAPNNETDYVYF